MASDATVVQIPPDLETIELGDAPEVEQLLYNEEHDRVRIYRKSDKEMVMSIFFPKSRTTDRRIFLPLLDLQVLVGRRTFGVGNPQYKVFPLANTSESFYAEWEPALNQQLEIIQFYQDQHLQAATIAAVPVVPTATPDNSNTMQTATTEGVQALFEKLNSPHEMNTIGLEKLLKFGSNMSLKAEYLTKIPLSLATMDKGEFLLNIEEKLILCCVTKFEETVCMKLDSEAKPIFDAHKKFLREFLETGSTDDAKCTELAISSENYRKLIRALVNCTSVTIAETIVKVMYGDAKKIKKVDNQLSYHKFDTVFTKIVDLYHLNHTKEVRPDGSKLWATRGRRFELGHAGTLIRQKVSTLLRLVIPRDKLPATVEVQEAAETRKEREQPTEVKRRKSLCNEYYKIRNNTLEELNEAYSNTEAWSTALEKGFKDLHPTADLKPVEATLKDMRNWYSKEKKGATYENVSQELLDYVVFSTYKTQANISLPLLKPLTKVTSPSYTGLAMEDENVISFYTDGKVAGIYTKFGDAILDLLKFIEIREPDDIKSLKGSKTAVNWTANYFYNFKLTSLSDTKLMPLTRKFCERISTPAERVAIIDVEDDFSVQRAAGVEDFFRPEQAAGREDHEDFNYNDHRDNATRMAQD